jgi:hypothetical protein
MFHLELRQSFHNFNHFNVSEPELRALVEPWVREQAIELGERKWSPHQAKLRILEGPHLPIEELSMGRGWRTAERESQDVTERVLAQARQALAAPPAASPPAPGPAESSAPAPGPAHAAPAPGQAGALADPLALGVQLAALLGDDPAGLLSAWRRVAARATGLTPSESLALAEREIGSTSDPGGGR